MDETELVVEQTLNNGQLIIKLSSTKNPHNTWTFPVDKDLVIGRSESCAIRLNDKSVSREQCKIVFGNSGISVINLSQTNKTILNGKPVAAMAEIKPGDLLKFGREEIRVDYIQSFVGGQAQNPNRKNDDTEYLS